MFKKQILQIQFHATSSDAFCKQIRFPHISGTEKLQGFSVFGKRITFISSISYYKKDLKQLLALYYGLLQLEERGKILTYPKNPTLFLYPLPIFEIP